MDFDLLSFVAGIATAAIPVAAAAVGSVWAQLKAAAERSATPLDNRLIDFVEAVADRIVEAKLSDPDDPFTP